jgi:Flp pilus assembly protein TadB
VNGYYIEPVFTPVPGLVLLVGGGIWMALGIFVMTRMVKIDV